MNRKEGISVATVSIIIILTLRFVQSYFTKTSSLYFPTTPGGQIRYVAYSKLVATAFGLIPLFLAGIGKLDIGALILGGISGLALGLGTVFGQIALRTGTTMVMSSVIGNAGMLIPCFAGIFMFGEKMSVWQWIGVAVFLVATVLLTRSAKATYAGFGLKTALLLFGNFVVNGVTMLCQKAMTYYFPEGNIAQFSFFTFLVPAVLSLAWVGIEDCRKKEKTEKLDKKLLLPMFVLAVAVFLINLLATEAGREMPSALLFTLINGGAMVAAAIVSAVCFHEKPTVSSVLGLLLGVISLVVIKAM